MASDELDDPQVLKRLLRRLALSTLAGLVAAMAGAALALVLYWPIVGGLELKYFTGWGSFLWLELGALISGVIAFSICWRRLKPSSSGD